MDDDEIEKLDPAIKAAPQLISTKVTLLYYRPRWALKAATDDDFEFKMYALTEIPAAVQTEDAIDLPLDSVIFGEFFEALLKENQ